MKKVLLCLVKTQKSDRPKACPQGSSSLKQEVISAKSELKKTKNAIESLGLGGLPGEENEGNLDGSVIEMGPKGCVDLGMQKWKRRTFPCRMSRRTKDGDRNIRGEKEGAIQFENVYG